MQAIEAPEQQAELKALVVEASRALARLDADRLEELALSCKALNRDLTPANRQELACQAREAAGDMAVFARVLEATRANLGVMNRLRDLHAGRVEYGEQQVLSPTGMERADGVN
ncbi:MAG TPA: hypothetical protein VH308_03140 [Terracidiphilus sp.]|jgi:hypothetical protein|nr:hypothetical protein [Terracidiphilus sp.]